MLLLVCFMLLFPIVYTAIGAVVCVAYRWDQWRPVDGQELMIDIGLWPILVYYWLRYGKML